MEITLEVCVIAFVVAIALLWLVFAAPREMQPTSQIIAADVVSLPDDVNDTVSLRAIDDAVVEIVHHGVPVAQGDTVNVIVTVKGTDVVIAEKRGLVAPAGSEPVRCSATSTMRLANCYPHTIRFESEITGQWAVMTFTPTNNARIASALRL